MMLIYFLENLRIISSQYHKFCFIQKIRPNHILHVSPSIISYGFSDAYLGLVREQGSLQILDYVSMFKDPG